MAVWQCRLLLSIVLMHLALSSPVVRRDVLELPPAPASELNPLSQLQPETLGEDVFGGSASEWRGGREKRLLKTIGVGTLGVKAAKAVGAKVVAGAAKAVGAKVLKAGAVAGGAIGLKAKAIGVKAVTAVAALGIKALLFKLLFGLSKSSLQPRSRPTTSAPTTAPGAEGDAEVPEFDPNKISLQVPDELFAPAFNSVNSISTVIGNLIQKTAERVARLVEHLKPVLRSSLGFKSRKRQTEKEENNDSSISENDELLDNETTYFSDSGGSSAGELQEKAESETHNSSADAQESADSLTQSSTADDSLNSSIKTSYTALVDNS